MARIAAFSDMQLSNHDPWSHPDLATVSIGHVDLCVVAGDHHPPLSRSIESLSALAARIPVVYVPGNRDYYWEEIEEATARARTLADAAGVILLQDDVIEVAGVRIVGSTLYTDYALLGNVDAALACAAERISDHRYVRTAHGPLTPVLAATYHARSRGVIEACLASPFEGPTVVVSHHAPHPLSQDPARPVDLTNAAFASDLSALLEGPEAPDLWIHGGTHHPADYVVGRTRVVSNPGGYVGEVRDFTLSKVIDLHAGGTR